jgi:hypothetical protein
LPLNEAGWFWFEAKMPQNIKDKEQVQFMFIHICSISTGLPEKSSLVPEYQ